MPDVQEANSQHSVTALVSGIVEDAQELLRQQLTLFKVELKHNVEQTRAALIPFVGGQLICVVSAVVLCLALAHLFSWLWPAVPLWLFYAIVGVAVGAPGVGLFLWSQRKLSELAPAKETVEAMKENIQWKTNT